MGMVGRGFSLLFMVAVATNILPLSFAAVYKVGDSAGWTTIGNVDYKKWASTKTFRVGDIIREFFSFLRLPGWILKLLGKGKGKKGKENAEKLLGNGFICQVISTIFLSLHFSYTF